MLTRIALHPIKMFFRTIKHIPSTPNPLHDLVFVRKPLLIELLMAKTLNLNNHLLHRAKTIATMPSESKVSFASLKRFVIYIYEKKKENPKLSKRNPK